VKITEAIENKIVKPAIRMHLMKIAEQFSKLKDENALHKRRSKKIAFLE